jgi:hypothetical protein
VEKFCRIFAQAAFSLFHFFTFSLFHFIFAGKKIKPHGKCGFFGFKAQENVNRLAEKSAKAFCLNACHCAGLTCFLPLFIERFIRNLIPEFSKNISERRFL